MKSVQKATLDHTHTRTHAHWGWPSGALVFGKLPVPGRPADLD